MERLVNRYIHFYHAGLFLLLLVVSGFSYAASVPVLLTFDTQEESDAIAINTMDLSQPATFFVAGQFVERHGKLVQQLAQQHTIGANSYSHIDLATLSQPELRKELLTSKMLLQEATGSAPVWFRAPLLTYNEQVMNTLYELGFLYDSSDSERWAKPKQLFELPISNSNDSAQILVSDYDIFERLNMSDEEALTWLKARYQERANSGRPLVVMLHPRLIIKHDRVATSLPHFGVHAKNRLTDATANSFCPDRPASATLVYQHRFTRRKQT